MVQGALVTANAVALTEIRTVCRRGMGWYSIHTFRGVVQTRVRTQRRRLSHRPTSPTTLWRAALARTNVRTHGSLQLARPSCMHTHHVLRPSKACPSCDIGGWGPTETGAAWLYGVSRHDRPVSYSPFASPLTSRGLDASRERLWSRAGSAARTVVAPALLRDDERPSGGAPPRKDICSAEDR